MPEGAKAPLAPLGGSPVQLSELATAIRSIATYFLVYNLFSPSLHPPTAVRCPQAAVILEF